MKVLAVLVLSFFTVAANAQSIDVTCDSGDIADPTVVRVQTLKQDGFLANPLGLAETLMVVSKKGDKVVSSNTISILNIFNSLAEINLSGPSYINIAGQEKVIRGETKVQIHMGNICGLPVLGEDIDVTFKEFINDVPKETLTSLRNCAPTVGSEPVI